MTQSRTLSAIESATNVAIGLAVSLAIWPIAVALFPSIHYTAGSHLGVVALYTAASLGRGYLVRRFFAVYIHRLAQKLAGD